MLLNHLLDGNMEKSLFAGWLRSLKMLRDLQPPPVNDILNARTLLLMTDCANSTTVCSGLQELLPNNKLLVVHLWKFVKMLMFNATLLMLLKK